MALIPDNANTIKAKIESVQTISKPRPYLGMSSINEECNALVWYNWRWASEDIINARTQRIFDRGHLEEARIIADLVAAGVEVFRRDEHGNKHPMTGAVGEAQEEFVGAWGHSKGHPDGRCLNLPEAPKTEHLLEMKTMKDAKFKEFMKKGLKDFDPKYWGQIHRYMGKAGLKRCLYVVTNKDNEEREYIRFHYDATVNDELERKEELIVKTNSPPMPSYPKTFYKCGWCKHKSVCHDKTAPLINCRTCEYSKPIEGGKWHCGFHQKEISETTQRAGCNQYKRLF